MKASELRRLRRLAAAIDGTPRCSALVDVEVRSAPAGSSSPGGVRFYSLVYDSLSEDLGGFRETIAPGAVDATISQDDVRALFNHDSNLVLGRSAPEKGIATATLTSDERGLLVDIPELPDTSYARDLLALLERGDVDQCSFGFRIADDGDSWERSGDQVVRTLREIRLFDVSIVTFPAYTATVAEARSLALALVEAREGKVLAQKHYDSIHAAIESLSNVLAAADAAKDDTVGDAPEWNSIREKRDGWTIYNLGSILCDCEDYLAWVADEDVDVVAMTEIVDLLKAMVVAEATEPDDERSARIGSLRARVNAEARDGYSVWWLGSILSSCESFVAYVADEDDDKSAMTEVISRLKAMVIAEATEDEPDEGSRSTASMTSARARLRVLELAAPTPPHALR